MRKAKGMCTQTDTHTYTHKHTKTHHLTLIPLLPIYPSPLSSTSPWPLSCLQRCERASQGSVLGSKAQERVPLEVPAGPSGRGPNRLPQAGGVWGGGGGGGGMRAGGWRNRNEGNGQWCEGVVMVCVFTKDWGKP